MSDSGELSPIVIDGGSSSFRAGFADDESPSLIIDSVIGREKEGNIGLGENVEVSKKVRGYVGKEVKDNFDSLTLHYPIERGIVTDWDGLESLWAHCFQELRVDPEEHCILMSHPPLNPRANKERLLELMFEAFNPAGFYLESTGRLILYSVGRHTGIVTDIGDGLTSTVPFYESHCFFDAIQRQDFGGRDLTSYLQKLLYEKGHVFATPSELQFVRQIKENKGFVTSEFGHDLKSSKSALKNVVTLPDGSSVTLDSERFSLPEVLFNPSLAGFPYIKGLPDFLESCWLNCDIDARSNICVNFIISGGCSSFPGLATRLKAELQQRIPRRRVNVVLGNPFKYSAWIGGSILASLSTFKPAFLTKKDYEEYGPLISFRN